MDSPYEIQIQISIQTLRSEYSYVTLNENAASQRIHMILHFPRELRLLIFTFHLAINFPSFIHKKVKK